MRTHVLCALLVTQVSLACSSDTSSLPDPQDQEDAGPGQVDEWDQRLNDREVDYNAALKAVALRLTGEPPTLEEITQVASAAEASKPAVYEAIVKGYLDDPRFEREMISFWRDTFKTGGDPASDTAAVFAAELVIEGRPMTELLTAATGTCPTYDPANGGFIPADCQNGVATAAGVLTNPALMAQFYSNMAFRRTRFVQETFACTAFPAEITDAVDVGGAALYTSPWPFESIAGTASGGDVDFLDVSAVACANCHSTMNHVAPLFAYFDESGQATADIAVKLPTSGNPPAALKDWLPAGQTTAWRLGETAADLPALGRAMAADPLVSECTVARAWNWALGKGDIVDTLQVVPSDVIADQVAGFNSGGANYKDLLLAVFTSDDFVKF